MPPLPNRCFRLAGLPALALLAACQTATETLVASAPQPPSIVLVAPVIAANPLNAQLTTTLPPTVPLRTALGLHYAAAVPGFASLYTVSTSGQVMRLFDNRAVRPGLRHAFPDRSEPVLRFDAPAGAEQFILLFGTQPIRWLAPTDFADRTPYPRLNLDPTTFEARLAAALATLPPGTWQVQRLTLNTQ